MKILHIIPSVSLVRGGTSIAILGTIRALRAHNVNAEIATTNDNGPEVLNVPINQKIQYQGVPVRFFSRFSPPVNAISEYAFSYDFSQWLWKNIQSYDLVEIHSFFSYVCSFSAAIARWKSVPYLISPHGQLLPWVISQKPLKKKIYTFLIERANLNRAAAIHCSTEREAQDVKNFAITSPTFVIPHGIEPLQTFVEAESILHKKYNIPKFLPIILFLARFHPKKRLDFLLEVLKSVEKNARFHVILAGSGDAHYMKYISDLIYSLNLQDRTTLAGFVAGSEKELLLQGSDIFVAPTFGENFGFSIVEAMYSKLPVITTPEMQITSDITREYTGFVVPGEKDLWVEAIVQLLNSAELREQMGENGKRLVERKFNWDIIARELTSVYTSILNGTKNNT